MKVGREYEQYVYESPFDTICIVVGVLIIIFTLIEIVILIREMRNETHKSQIYLLNLALSDFIMGLCLLTVFGTSKYKKYNPKDAEKHHRWLLPLQIYCIIGGIRFNLMMSIFSLAALTVDRVLAVIRPFYHRNMKNRYASFVCAFTWIISLVLSSLNVFLANGAHASYQLIEVSHIGNNNNSVALRHFEISTYAFYQEIKVLTTKTELLENVQYVNESWFQDGSVRRIEVDSWGDSNKVNPYGYRSEDQGELEYKIIPVLVYVTVVILLGS